MISRPPPPAVETFLLTASGAAFDFLSPRAEDVHPADLAHALSHLCRFGGHTRAFYSVAQHSVLVSSLVPPAFALAGLLHDAAGAYRGDVVTPLKDHLPEYRRLEGRLSQAIERRFGCYPGALHAPEILAADREALACERAALLPAGGPPWGALRVVVVRCGVAVEPLPSMAARRRFLDRLGALGVPA